uniref:ATP-dependent DNA helicase n=1 Tax=Oryzias melastigma TaxID=30732 RepID=A0A3B3C0I1_ORYME
MPRKGKRSQAAKTRWQKVSLPDCENDNNGGMNNSGSNINDCELLQTSVHDIEEQRHLNPGDCVQASHSQNYDKYHTFSRNKQCTCNSLVFLSFLNENENITIADLDKVLDKGDSIYCEQRKIFPNNPFLAFDELPDIVTARANVYNVNKELESRFGSFKDPVPEAAKNYLDLTAGLSCLLSDVQYALLIMSNLCIAVFRTSCGKYGFFDPHARTSTGMPVLPGANICGTAIMLTFANLQDMIETLDKCFETLGVLSSEGYQLQPVEFHPLNATSELNSELGFLNYNNEDVSPLCGDENTEYSDGEKLAQSAKRQKTKMCSNMESQAAFNEDKSSVSDIEALIPILMGCLPSNNDKSANGITEKERNRNNRPSNAFNEVHTSPDNIKRRMLKLNTNRRQKFLRLKRQCQKNENCQEKPISSENLATKKRLYSQHLYQTDPIVRQKKRNFITHLYQSVPEFREKQKRLALKRYHSKADVRQKQKQFITDNYKNNPNFRNKQKQFIRENYKTNPDFRQRQKTVMTARYQSSPDIRQKQRSTITTRYRTCSEFRQKLKSIITKRYRSSPEFRQKHKSRMTTHYRTSPEYHQKHKSRMTTRYRTSPEFRQKHKSRMTTHYRTSPEYHQKHKSIMATRYRTSPEICQKQKRRITEHYQTCKEFQHKQKQFAKKRYLQCADVRQKQRMYIVNRYKNNIAFCKKQKSYMTKRYVEDKEFQNKHRELMRKVMLNKYRNNKAFQMKQKCALQIKKKYKYIFVKPAQVSEDGSTSQATENQRLIKLAITSFKANVKSGPTFICTVCHKASFPNQVKSCNRSKYTKNVHVVEQCLTGEYVHACTTCKENCTVPNERRTEWICYTCHNYVKVGRMPPLAVANNLQLADIPEDLCNLNILERHLIAKCIPFAKIVPLPKGRQHSIRGNVVCVPSEVQETVDTLPRIRSQSQVLRVKLKRRLCYKGHQLFQSVTWSKLMKALHKLKQIHPQYQDISIRDEPEVCDPTLVDEVSDDDQESAQPHVSQKTLCETNAFSNEQNVPETEHVNTDQTTNDTIETQAQVDNDEQEGDLPNGGLALESCLQPPNVAEDILSFTEGIYSVAPAERNSPVGFFKTPHLEAISFPVQFPTGQNTLDSQRPIKLTPSQYFKSRMFSVDDRFAKDINYLFFAQFVTEINLATSSMTIQLRKGKPFTRDGRRITSRMLRDKEEVEKLIKNRDAIRFMQPLRGTPAYWEKTTKDLFAMIRQLGNPTWFLTVSAAEMRWPEVIQAIKRQQGEEVNFEALNWTEKTDILRSNPVTTMRMFEKRVEALFRDLILSAAQILGRVIDFFFRVEYQNRGSPHIHCLLWVDGAPVFDKDDDQTVCSFISKYISAQLPNPTTQPELYKTVKEVQTHSRNHPKACFKYPGADCRFGFPKPPSDQTMITRPDENSEDSLEVEKAKAKLRPLNALLKEPESETLTFAQLLAKCSLTLTEYKRCLHLMKTSSTVILKRDPKDCWVNAYNPHVLQAFDSNMDLSFILNAYSVIMYLTSYITKQEHGLSEYLKTVIENSSSNSTNQADDMKEVMQAYSKKREISAQECVTRLCGLPMKKSSRGIVFVPTDDNAVKMSRPISQLEDMTSESEEVWMRSLADKYKCRPETTEFENMCMADFAATCRLVYGQERKAKGVLPLLNGMGFVKRRNKDKPAVIRFYRPSEKKNPEQFFQTQLKLYLPYRSEDDLKRPHLPTYQSFYHSGYVHLRGSEYAESVQAIVRQNQDKYEKNSKNVEQAIEEYEQNRDSIDEWCNLAPESELVRLQCVSELQRDEHIDENEQENVPEYSRQANSSTEIRAIREAPLIDHSAQRQMYQSLNQQQACVFFAVRDWCIKRVNGFNPQQFLYYVNGGAGTGKSHLIKSIHAQASNILRRSPRNAEEHDVSGPSVLLTSFTGTAAFQISGTTLHSLLRLPRILKPPIQGLGNLLDEVRAELLNAEIIIIDEVSMVSKVLFSYVDARLKQIKGSQKPFGGMSVLAVGDFYQLPPVRQSKPLCVPEQLQADLWNEHFQMVTLTEIMRQKDDVAFAEMLNRIRVKDKSEELSQEDRALLTQAVTQPALCPIDALHIFATNKQVNDHNSSTLSKLHANIIALPAHDYKKDLTTGRMTRQDQPMKGNSNDLLDTISVAEGARLMLTRNIDIRKGLVNGAFGELKPTYKAPLLDTAFCLKDTTCSTGTGISRTPTSHSWPRKVVEVWQFTLETTFKSLKNVIFIM